MEERIDGEHVYRGRVVSVRVDRVRQQSGHETTREVVEHPGAVAILPVLEDGRILLVRQYRYAVGRALLEVPAGTREPGEAAEECARREIQEEVGKRAGSLELLARFYISPGWCNEEMVIYRATNLTDAALDPDEDEIIDIVTVVPEQVHELIQSGQVADAKTITALLMHLEKRDAQADSV